MAAIACAMLVLSCLPAKAGEGAAERKADYYYMEAMRQNALGNKDAYYELLRRCHDLDPGNTDVGFLTGFIQVLAAGEDSTMLADGYRMIRDHFRDDPADLYAGNVLANVSAHLGRPDVSRQVWATLDSIYPDKIQVAFNYAEALSSSRDTADWDKAMEVYRRVESADGPSTMVSSRKVNVMMQQRDTAAVIRELDALMAASPRSAECRVFAGTVFSALGQRDSAIYYYDRACEVDPTNGMAYYARANFYKETGNMQAYDSEVFTALKQEDLDLDTKMQILTGYVRELYSDSLQQPRIEELFKVLIDQHPHEVDIRDLFSSYYVAIEDYRNAAEQMGYAIDIDPADEGRWRMLMSLHSQSRDWHKAIDTGINGLHYHPQSPMLNMLTGVDYSMTDDFPNALKYLDRALELADSVLPAMRGDVLTAIGDAYYKAAVPDSAFAYYELAITADPGNLLALNNCAYYLACEGRDLDRAEAMITTVIREKPTDPTSLDTYAWILFKKRDFAKAKDYIDTALANNTEDSEELLHHAGDIYFMAGFPDEAVVYWTDALKLAPDNELLQRKVRHKTYFVK